MAKIIDFSANCDFAVGYVITNNSKNPKFVLPGGAPDKSFTVQDIHIIRLEGNKPKPWVSGNVPGYASTGTVNKGWVNEGSVSVELEGGTILRNNTIFPRYKTGQVWPDPKTKIPAMNSLPKDLLPGESFAFRVRIKKDSGQRITGRYVIRIQAVGPAGGNKPVVINDQYFDITTANDFYSNPFDPLAQTFFVDGRIYDEGVFISSIDLWFKSKGIINPVTVEIRPVVNGYPSSLEVLPFAVAVKNPEDVLASPEFDPDSFTRFKFESPVHLVPGQYSFVVLANTEYILYTAGIGEFELNSPTTRVTEQPYIGSLFLSQNASTWTPDQTKDLTFRINICDFGATNSASVVLNVEDLQAERKYDLINTTGDMIKFPSSGINNSFATTDAATLTFDPFFRGYVLGTNYALDSRKTVAANSGTSIKFKVDLTTNNRYVAPVIDLNRFGSALVRNIINDPGVGLEGEDGYSGGNADARYISRRVVLNPGFEAQDIRLYLNAYLPSPSRIIAFFKVNAPGTIDFEGQNKWVQFANVAVVGDSVTGFAEHTFTTNGTCLPDSAFFNTFSIKVVMLSTDPVYVPIIRDLRAIALEAA